jgi:putative transcriptional regulator
MRTMPPNLLAKALVASLAVAIATAQPSPQLRGLRSGVFLVSAKDLPDPNFSNTVVLLSAYGPGGAMGLIMNRPSNVPVSRLFPSSGSKARVFKIHEGGPVGRAGAIALLRSTSKPDAGADTIIKGVYLISSKEELEKALGEASPEALRVYLGYSGWASGQLEREVSLGAWDIVPATAALIFDAKLDTLWRRLHTEANSRIALRWSPK